MLTRSPLFALPVIFAAAACGGPEPRDASSAAPVTVYNTAAVGFDQKFLISRLTFALLGFACVGLWAQAISTSQIKGTVQDPSGSVVPGAEVTVTQCPSRVA